MLGRACNNAELQLCPCLLREHSERSESENLSFISENGSHFHVQPFLLTESGGWAKSDLAPLKLCSLMPALAAGKVCPKPLGT